jgi:ubiquinone/menaquinone biosynthesis C-methylase UbiE
LRLDLNHLAAALYDPAFDRLNRRLRAIALDLLPPRPGEVVLDIGCGTGSQLALYRDRGCRAFGSGSCLDSGCPEMPRGAP